MLFTLPVCKSEAHLLGMVVSRPVFATNQNASHFVKFKQTSINREVVCAHCCLYVVPSWLQGQWAECLMAELATELHKSSFSVLSEPGDQPALNLVSDFFFFTLTCQALLTWVRA